MSGAAHSMTLLKNIHVVINNLPLLVVGQVAYLLLKSTPFCEKSFESVVESARHLFPRVEAFTKCLKRASLPLAAKDFVSKKAIPMITSDIQFVIIGTGSVEKFRQPAKPSPLHFQDYFKKFSLISISII